MSGRRRWRAGPARDVVTRLSRSSTPRSSRRRSATRRSRGTDCSTGCTPRSTAGSCSSSPMPATARPRCWPTSRAARACGRSGIGSTTTTSTGSSILHHLVAAGREHDPTFAPATLSMLAETGLSGPSREAVLDVFIRELPTIAPTGAAPDPRRLPPRRRGPGHAVHRPRAHRPGARAPVARVREPTRARRSRSRVFARTARSPSSARTTFASIASETDRLFSETYGRTLEPDVLDDVAATDRGLGRVAPAGPGGAARSDTRGDPAVRSRPVRRGPGAVRLPRGGGGRRSPGDLQQFLMQTSILQVVTPGRWPCVGDRHGCRGRRPTHRHGGAADAPRPTCGRSENATALPPARPRVPRGAPGSGIGGGRGPRRYTSGCRVRRAIRLAHGRSPLLDGRGPGARVRGHRWRSPGHRGEGRVLPDRDLLAECRRRRRAGQLRGPALAPRLQARRRRRRTCKRARRAVELEPTSLDRAQSTLHPSRSTSATSTCRSTCPAASPRPRPTRHPSHRGGIGRPDRDALLTETCQELVDAARSHSRACSMRSGETHFEGIAYLNLANGLRALGDIRGHARGANSSVDLLDVEFRWIGAGVSACRTAPGRWRSCTASRRRADETAIRPSRDRIRSSESTRSRELARHRDLVRELRARPRTTWPSLETMGESAKLGRDRRLSHAARACDTIDFGETQHAHRWLPISR